MEHQTITRKGKRYILLEEAEARRLGLIRDDDEAGLPQLPAVDKDGHRPAIDFARASIARQIIRDRKAANLSQAELARRAGIRVETLNRLEKAKHTPDVKTMESIERVFRTIERSRKASGPNVIGMTAVGDKIIEIDGRTGTMRERAAKRSTKWEEQFIRGVRGL